MHLIKPQVIDLYHAASGDWWMSGLLDWKNALPILAHIPFPLPKRLAQLLTLNLKL